MKAKIAACWLILVVFAVAVFAVAPGLADAQNNRPPFPVNSQSLIAASSDLAGTEIGTEGGTIDLMGRAELTVPAGALPARSRISRYTVEPRLSSGLNRYHPVDQPIRIEAFRSDNNSRVTTLQRPLTVRWKLNRPEIPVDLLGDPGVRALKRTGWELVDSSYDSASKTFTISLTELPVILAAVDKSKPPAPDGWDPSDPAAVQFSDGNWGVAFYDPGSYPNYYLKYRRTLTDQGLPFWLDAITVETNGDAPAMVRLGSTLALFYRKASGSIKQVFIKTSTDDGVTWSSATQLTTEAVDIYQIQASVTGGTVYLFFSLSNTSGLLQYRTSTDLTNWTAKASVGQAIGPLESSTYPNFDIKRLASGTWVLAWLERAACTTQDPPGCDSYDISAMNSNPNGHLYPVAWVGTLSDLSSAASNKKELNRPFYEPWPGYVSVAQASNGTVYVAYTHYVSFWDDYGYYRTSSNDGASWASKVEYAYEPARGTGGSKATDSLNPYLVVDNSGGVRSFWDQKAQNVPGYTDGYPVQLFRRDLPSGAITPISLAKDEKTQCGICPPAGAFEADPINTTTGNFTLPETDVSIAGKGPGLVFQRTYNSGRLVDGPLGFGWTHNYDTRLASHTQGEVLILDGSGRSDLYTPAGGGNYNKPTARSADLVQNGDGTWTLTEPNKVKRTFSSAGKLTAISDRNNNSVTLSYDGSGLLTTITDPAGRTLTLGYTNGRITSISVPLSRTISFAYTGSDLTSVVDMRGKTWSYTYDSSHRMLTKVDPNSHTVLTNTYGGKDRVIKQADAKGKETLFKYADSGGSTEVTDPRGNMTRYNYDTKYRVTQTTDPYGKYIYYYYDDATSNLTQINDQRKGGYNRTYFTYDTTGNVLTRKNELNKTWTYTYNSFNDVLTETDPLNHTTTYTYNTSGNLTAITNAKSETTNFTPNSYGQVTSITDARSKTTTFGYDTYGYQNTVTNPYNKTWTTVYDAGGRKTSVTDPLTHATSYGYDNNNNLTSLTDGRGKITSYIYDNANNLTSVTDPNNKTTTYAYDEKNRLITVTDAATGVTSYAYDENDNRTSMTDANNHARSWTYDKNNRMLTETDALSKTATYEYDGAGNRTKRVDSNAAITNYTYDTINRLTGIKYAQGSVSYGYNDANLRTSMTDSTGTTSYAYDELNRLSSVTFPGNKVVSYQYDAAGNRTRITYPDSKVVDYTYDDANRMSTVTDWLTKQTSYTYDDAGRLITTGFPTGVSEARSYTNADQLTSIVATKGGNTVTSFTYTVDDAGIRTAVQDPSGAESYSYDNLYRLTGVTYPDTTTQSYTYDSVGNRLTKVQGGTTSYTYDNGDRMTAAGSTTYTYDNNGNQKSRTSGGQTTTYCWDVFDRLTQFTDSATSPQCPVSPVRLNAGGALYTDGTSNNWAPDTFFSGGTAGSTAAAIANTTDDPLYQYYRYGTSFNYAIPLPTAGSYTVTLKFVEPTKSAAGQRKFDVSLEGTLVLDDFDIYAAAGGRFIALDRSFTTTVNDGTLNLAFTGVVDNAIVSAIEVVWAGGSPPAPIASYVYRGDGLRHSKTVSGNTTSYTWDINSKLPVILQDGTYTYVYGLDLISQTDGSGTQSYFLANGLGSTEALTDGTGTVTATYKYDVFGAVRSTSGTGSTEYRFTGEQDDATAGYTYLRARYYDPASGRFVSKDPFPGLPTNPTSQHYYAYAHNSPTNGVDPSGEIFDTIFDVGSILYDIYRIFADNVFGDSDNAGENVTALLADVGGALIPVATGGGLVTRASARGIDAVDKMSEVRRLGKAGEEAAGITKNTRQIDSFYGGAKYRIPDILDRRRCVIGDVKNVSYQPLTGQLRDYLKLAEMEGFMMELYVRQSTRFSAPLQKLIDEGKIIPRNLP